MVPPFLEGWHGGSHWLQLGEGPDKACCADGWSWLLGLVSWHAPLIGRKLTGVPNSRRRLVACYMIGQKLMITLHTMMWRLVIVPEVV